MKNHFFTLPVGFVAILVTNAVGQQFDERMSDWPIDLRINGTVMASSGDTLTESQIDYFYTAAGAEDAKIVTIDLRDKADSKATENHWKEAATNLYFHMPGESFDPGGDSTERNKAIDAIMQATGVFLLANKPLSEEQGPWLIDKQNELRSVIERRGVVFSSGPVTQILGLHQIKGNLLQDDATQGDTSHALIGEGLRLIPDVVLQTDYESETGRLRLMSVLASHPRSIGIGLDPETTLVLRGRKIRAMGNGKLHFITMANDRVPLRTKSIAGPRSRRDSPYDIIVDLTGWRRDAIDRTLEEFPSATPEKPLVENGTLMIIGGGSIPDGMMEQFIELAGGENAKLVFIPCLERAESGRRENGLIRAWKEAGVLSADVVHTKDRHKANSDEEFLAPLKDATGIFFGGGRQWNFSDSYYGTQAHRLMKEVLQRGGVIAGSSAGASIQGRYLARANPVGNIDIMAPGYERGGLGFISGVAIDQHFTQRGRQPDMTSLVNQYPQLLGIGIDESTAIVVTKSIAEVVGEGEVFFYARDKHAAHDDPDYVALQAGAKYDLGKREVMKE